MPGYFVKAMKHLSLWLPIRSIAFLLVFVGCAGILGQDLCEIGCRWSVIVVILNCLTIGLLVFLAKRDGQTAATSFIPGLYQTMCDL